MDYDAFSPMRSQAFAPTHIQALLETHYRAILNTLTIHFYRGVGNAFLGHSECITMHFGALEIVP